MTFLLIAVTLDMDIAILGVRNLSFGRLGASTLPPWGPFLQKPCFRTNRVLMVRESNFNVFQKARG